MMTLPAELPVARAATSTDLVRTARVLAHAVNNRLVLPLGLPELLEARAAIPADLRPLFAPARQALEEIRVEAVHLEALTHPPLGA